MTPFFAVVGPAVPTRASKIKAGCVTDVILGVVTLAAVPVAQAESVAKASDALIATGPQHLSHRDENMLVWKNGTRIPIDDDKAKSH